jgi:hypothetical protein
MQLTFARLWDNFATDKDAIKARNKKAKELREKGYTVNCSSIPNQVKKYDGLGQPNGGVCTVYMIDYR